MSLNNIAEIIEDIRQGKMVILMDDEDRENEGDLIMASHFVRADDINFMARYGRGLICLTLTAERCQQLNLPLMVSDSGAKHHTNFTVSIEAAQGVTTGISAADRATTVQAAVAADVKASDIVQPGHIFPLMARPGGVLARAGHTEAGCDLARLAGLEPSSVIVEILNEDGSMARRSDLEIFAKTHDLKIGTVEELIRYRHEFEKTVYCVSACNIDTRHGPFQLKAYEDSVDGQVHLALIYGELQTDAPVLVRVHLEDELCDPFGMLNDAQSWSLDRVMATIAAQGSGVIVMIRKGDDPKGLVKRIMDIQLKEKGVTMQQPNTGNDVRTVGVGSQILADLGVRQMRVMGAPKKMHGLSGFGLEVVDYLSDDGA